MQKKNLKKTQINIVKKINKLSMSFFTFSFIVHDSANWKKKTQEAWELGYADTQVQLKNVIIVSYN